MSEAKLFLYHVKLETEIKILKTSMIIWLKSFLSLLFVEMLSRVGTG